MQKFNFDEFLKRNNGQTYINYVKKYLNLFKPATNGPWICGGSIRRIVGNYPLLDGDFDIYFTNATQRNKTEAEIQVMGGKIIDRNEFNTTWQITVDDKKVDVQTIGLKYFKNVEHCLSDFDLTLCQFGYDGTDLFCGDFALWDLAKKKIKVNNLAFGVNTIQRIIKYSKMGFNITNDEIIVLLEQLNKQPEKIKEEKNYI